MDHMRWLVGSWFLPVLASNGLRVLVLFVLYTIGRGVRRSGIHFQPVRTCVEYYPFGGVGALNVLESDSTSPSRFLFLRHGGMSATS